jgi:hypothetical protein
MLTRKVANHQALETWQASPRIYTKIWLFTVKISPAVLEASLSEENIDNNL